MNLGCSGVTTENSAICVFFLVKYGVSVVSVILTAVFLSIIVEIEWDISRLAASVNFPTGDTVPVVCHSDGWSTDAVIDFVVIGGTVVLSWIRTSWGLALVYLQRLWLALSGVRSGWDHVCCRLSHCCVSWKAIPKWALSNSSLQRNALQNCCLQCQI